MTSRAYIASHPDLRNPSSSTSPVPSLYSSLSSLRTTNPSAYHANAKWWSTTLHDWAWKGVQSQAASSSSSPPARLVLTVDATLVDAFTLNDDAARPTAIPTAIAAMIKAGELVPLKAYLAAKDPIRKGAKTPISSSSSSANSLIPTPRQVLSFTVARPFWFAMRLAGLSSNEDDEDDDHAAGQYDEDEDWPRVTGSWVSLPNLEKATSLVLSQASAQVPSSCPLLSMQAFRALVRQALPHFEAEVDCEVLLKHLARDKRVAVVEGQVVKLSAEGQGNVQPITEEERSIFAVRETHARLTVQVADIEHRIALRTEEVKAILKTTTGSAQASSSANPRIRHLLSSRRALTSLLTRRLSSLSQLESVLLRIEQASDDVTLLSAYEAADAALRGLHKQSGGAERAEEVMMRLEESVADQRDVEEAMRLGGVGVNGGDGELDDEEELRREMERLEVEEKEDKEQRRLQQQQAEAQKAGAAQAAAAAAAARSEDAAAPKESTTPQQQPQADKPAAASQDASTNQATSAQQRQQQQQREPVLNE